LGENLLFLKQLSPNNAPEWQDIAQILAVAVKQAELLQTLDYNPMQWVFWVVYTYKAII
ncbi:MAG: hypothetical protein HC907_05785, partial [Richelia sp. SM1_7_0]|nr:hypothetical protein [Richelia sp. SM1_7_0]